MESLEGVFTIAAGGAAANARRLVGENTYEVVLGGAHEQPSDHAAWILRGAEVPEHYTVQLLAPPLAPPNFDVPHYAADDNGELVAQATESGSGTRLPTVWMIVPRDDAADTYAIFYAREDGASGYWTAPAEAGGQVQITGSDETPWVIERIALSEDE